MTVSAWSVEVQTKIRLAPQLSFSQISMMMGLRIWRVGLIALSLATKEETTTIIRIILTLLSPWTHHPSLTMQDPLVIVITTTPTEIQAQ